MKYEENNWMMNEKNRCINNITGECSETFKTLKSYHHYPYFFVLYSTSR